MSLEEIYNNYLKYPHISIDSRKIIENCFFVAIGRKNEKGVHRGCEFAELAMDSGAAVVMFNDPELKAKHDKDDRWILVEDCEMILQQLGRYHREQLNIPVIAIAGSNGKTTTKEILQAVLSQKYSTFATPGNLNNQLGVPLSLLQIGKHHEIAIIEVGANHLEETSFLCKLVQPTYGLVTNCGKDHLGEYGSYENIIKANKELYDYFEENGGLVFVNERDDILVESSKKVEQRIFYGDDNNSIRSEILNSPLLEIRLWINDHSADIKTFLFGDFWKDTLMAAAQIGYQFGLNLDQIKDAMESYKPAALRSQITKWYHSDLILDCYNANPSSMEVFVKAVQQSPESPKILILGEMLELGEYSEEEHQYLIDQVIMIEKFEKVILVGNEFFKIKLPSNKRLLHFEKNAFAKDFINQYYKDTSAFIYVKGSRGNKLEEIFDIKH